MQTTPFLESNLFIGLITFAVGLFGFVLYKMRNKDSKRRTARIIMLEITNAETQLRDARNRLEDSEKGGIKKLPEHLYVMPLDTWTGNRHLFVNDFKTNEWEAINEFYDKCQLFDEAIKENDGRFAKDEQLIRTQVHQATYDLAFKMVDKLDADAPEAEIDEAKEEFFAKRNALASFITTGENVWIYAPSKQMRDVEYILANVNYNLSTSSVGTKLTKLSKRKFLPNLSKQ